MYGCRPPVFIPQCSTESPSLGVGSGCHCLVYYSSLDRSLLYTFIDLLGKHLLTIDSM